jgi:hypothetical protein
MPKMTTMQGLSCILCTQAITILGNKVQAWNEAKYLGWTETKQGNCVCPECKG